RWLTSCGCVSGTTKILAGAKRVSSPSRNGRARCVIVPRTRGALFLRNRHRNKLMVFSRLRLLAAAAAKLIFTTHPSLLTPHHPPPPPRSSPICEKLRPRQYEPL